jgi:hypothetical protein
LTRTMNTFTNNNHQILAAIALASLNGFFYFGRGFFDK